MTTKLLLGIYGLVALGIVLIVLTSGCKGIFSNMRERRQERQEKRQEWRENRDTIFDKWKRKRAEQESDIRTRL